MLWITPTISYEIKLIRENDVASQRILYTERQLRCYFFLLALPTGEPVPHHLPPAPGTKYQENTVLPSPAQSPGRPAGAQQKQTAHIFRSKQCRQPESIHTSSFSMPDCISKRAGLIFQVLCVLEKICRIQLFLVWCKSDFLSLSPQGWEKPQLVCAWPHAAGNCRQSHPSPEKGFPTPGLCPQCPQTASLAESKHLTPGE